jgi:hypothetical protein
MCIIIELWGAWYKLGISNAMWQNVKLNLFSFFLVVDCLCCFHFGHRNDKLKSSRALEEPCGKNVQLLLIILLLEIQSKLDKQMDLGP